MKKSKSLIFLIIFVTALRPTFGLGIFGLGFTDKKGPDTRQMSIPLNNNKSPLLACQPKQLYTQNNNSISFAEQFFISYFSTIAVISVIYGLTYLVYLEKKYKPVRNCWDKFLKRIGLREFPNEKTNLDPEQKQEPKLEQKFTKADYLNPQKFFDAIENNKLEFIKAAIEKGFDLEKKYAFTDDLKGGVRITEFESFNNTQVNMFDFALHQYCQSKNILKKAILIYIIQEMQKKSPISESLLNKENPIIPIEDTLIKTETKLKTNRQLILEISDPEMIKLIKQQQQIQIDLETDSDNEEEIDLEADSDDKQKEEINVEEQNAILKAIAESLDPKSIEIEK